MMDKTRILAFDTSLHRPGIALIEISAGKAKVIALSHITTESTQNHAVRSRQVEAWALLFIGKYVKNGFDVIIREDFQGRSSRQNHPVFSAWSSCDRALNAYGLTFTTPAISPSKIKRLVTGKGSADKDAVADVVRELTGYIGEFGSDDESDAVSIGLAYAIDTGLIKRKGDE